MSPNTTTYKNALRAEHEARDKLARVLAQAQAGIRRAEALDAAYDARFGHSH